MLYHRVLSTLRNLCSELGDLGEKVNFRFEVDFGVLYGNLVDFLQVLINEVHVCFVKRDIDKSKELDLFVMFLQPLIVVIDITFELGIEVALDYAIVVLFKS